VTFCDRDDIAHMVERTQAQGGGIRTLMHELVDSPLFRTH
jgi:hypothetical protein